MSVRVRCAYFNYVADRLILPCPLCLKAVARTVNQRNRLSASTLGLEASVLTTHSIGSVPFDIAPAIVLVLATNEIAYAAEALSNLVLGR